MSATGVILAAEALKAAAAIYMYHAQLAGKTEAEIKEEFKKVLVEVMAFDPNSIKDV